MAFMRAIAVLRPGINCSNIGNVGKPAEEHHVDGVRWDDPLPAGFVPPTQAEVVAMMARLQTVPPSIASWKAHAILKIDGKHQAVVDVIAAIADPATRELVQIAFERLDPIPRASTTLVSLLTHPTVGYTEAGVDDLFVRGNALQIDAG